jgi:hypothetical protein
MQLSLHLDYTEAGDRLTPRKAVSPYTCGTRGSADDSQVADFSDGILSPNNPVDALLVRYASCRLCS